MVKAAACPGDVLTFTLRATAGPQRGIVERVRIHEEMNEKRIVYTVSFQDGRTCCALAINHDQVTKIEPGQMRRLAQQEQKRRRAAKAADKWRRKNGKETEAPPPREIEANPAPIRANRLTTTTAKRTGRILQTRSRSRRATTPGGSQSERG